ncbi:PAS domain S-box protein [Thalassobaculum sp. OXR-137]|uniref:PAS domain-containing hybrid sensor histidine kinase/response regulator n=1 Tax=Thalassobaculum sp. OXR-137 TaxID=3100173 RepID=UPI002AC9240B|nr:PAS domain S-box protein [Thalassobaculum sp. OXR-137]WPZ32929.1 PAS domain S-box protein [Thalassobaculum sp. OXR-137]
MIADPKTDRAASPASAPVRYAEMGEAHRAALLDFAVAHSSIVFYLVDIDADRRTVYISDNVEAVTGHPAARFVDDSGFGTTLIHPEDTAAYFATLDAVPEKSGETVIEYRLRDSNGDYMWIRDRLRRIEGASSGEPRMLVGSMADITIEKEAVARVGQAEAINRVLLGNVLDAIVATDEQGLIVEFNPAAEKMFGYSRGRAIGQPIGDLIVPDAHRAGHDSGMAQFMANGRMSRPSRRMETQAKRADGSLFPVEIAIAHAEIEGKAIIISDIQDISERLAARAERQKIAQLLQDAINSMSEGFVISAPDSTVLFCNEAFSAPYGMTPDEMVGSDRTQNIKRFFRNVRRFDGRLVEGDTNQIRWIVSRLADFDGHPIEVELTNGEWRLMVNHRTTDGGSVTIRADITQRKRAEQSLRQSEALIRRILDACPVPVGMTRAIDGRIIYESPASRQMFQRDSMGGTLSARDFFVDAADRDRYLDMLRRDRRVDAFETFLRRSDGHEFCASISARLVEYQGQEVVVSSTYDLTERRKMEEEMARQREALHQSEKLSALGELLAGVSHELNNPLSVVVGQAMLLRETAKDAAIVERARKIGDAADRCARIVKTFLAMARQQPSEMRPVRLNDIVESALEMTGYMLRTHDVDVSLELNPTVPAILADGDQINQVLTNLIVNALHAMENQPMPHRLRLVTHYDRGRRQAVLKVRDNGRGVPEEMASRIFEPFFTTKDLGEGTGIGLTIVHRIVDAHGGSICLDSTPGKGTTFTLRFPTCAAEGSEDGAEDDAGDDTGLTVLVIDDEPEVAEIIRESLVFDGHTVDVVTSGRAALERLLFRQYDAILSDVRMPDLDGPALYSVICDRHPELLSRMAFVTGDTMSPAIRRFLDEAGRPYLEKPVMPAELRGLIARLAEAAS